MILFIDDEPRIMDSYKEYLELKLAPEGYDVRFVNNVDEALALVDEQGDQLDLVILDMMMPWGKHFSREKTNGGFLTGVAFFEKLRSKWPDLPVLVFTNYADEELERKLEQDSRCHFRQKTDLLLDDFVTEVQELIGPRK